MYLAGDSIRWMARALFERPAREIDRRASERVHAQVSCCGRGSERCIEREDTRRPGVSRERRIEVGLEVFLYIEGMG